MSLFPTAGRSGAQYNVTAMTEYRRRNVTALTGLPADGGGRGGQVSTPHRRAGPAGRALKVSTPHRRAGPAGQGAALCLRYLDFTALTVCLGL